MSERHDKAITPPNDFVQLHALVPAADVSAPAGTRGLLIEVGGTLNVTMENGVQRSLVPFPTGLTPGLFTAVRTGGTASNIWAVT